MCSQNKMSKISDFADAAFFMHLIPIMLQFSLRLFNAFLWFDVQTAECINPMLHLLALSSQKPFFSCSARKHQYFTPGLKDGVKM